MGRKGAAKGSKPEGQEEHHVDASASPAQDPAAAAAAGPASDDDSEAENASGPESRSQMLKRHKGELTAHKKAMQRLGKKSKDELAKLNKEIEDRHAAELAAVEAAAPEPQRPKEEDKEAEAAVEAGVSNLNLASEAFKGKEKQSKAAKRREKLEQQEAERLARIAEELASQGPSSRMQEEEQLTKLLAPLAMGMKEIKADGHCLYRAIEDQLSQHSSSEPAPTHLELRQRAAAYIRAHASDFVHFIYDEDKAGDPDAQLAAYCDELESTAVWGGQLELGALAEVLKCKIEVYAVGMPVVTLGEAYLQRTLHLCYLRHAFGLGEHYNSMVPLKQSTGDL